MKPSVHSSANQSLIILVCLLLFAPPLSADILKGRVIDAETKEPLPEATSSAHTSISISCWTSIRSTPYMVTST